MLALSVLPAAELAKQLRAAADERRFDRLATHDYVGLMREAADRIERAEASRRRLLMGGGS